MNFAKSGRNKPESIQALSADPQRNAPNKTMKVEFCCTHPLRPQAVLVEMCHLRDAKDGAPRVW